MGLGGANAAPPHLPLSASIPTFSKIKFKTMPKQLIKRIHLPTEQPDCCALCPLVGVIPKGQTSGQYTHICCATRDALTRRGIRVEASKRDSKHPWHRPCDDWWDSFISHNPRHEYGIPMERYWAWRKPYEDTLQLQIKFPKRKTNESTNQETE